MIIYLVLGSIFLFLVPCTIAASLFLFNLQHIPGIDPFSVAFSYMGGFLLMLIGPTLEAIVAIICFRAAYLERKEIKNGRI